MICRFSGDHNSRRTQFFYSSVTIFFHNTLKLQGELAEAQPDLPVINGPHYDMGATNVPWNSLRWDGSHAILDTMDALLAEEMGRASNSDELDKDDITEDDIRTLVQLRQQQNEEEDGYAWYRMLPGSQLEEESMLQAALKASFEETVVNDEETSSPQAAADHSLSSKAEHGSTTDPSSDDTVEGSSPVDDKEECVPCQRHKTAMDAPLPSGSDADPPSKEDMSD